MKLIRDIIWTIIMIVCIFILTMLIMVTGCGQAYGQNVYVTKYPWQADTLVYVTE